METTRPPLSAATPTDRRSPTRWVWSHVRRHPLLPTLAVLGEIGHGAALVATAFLLGRLVDGVFSGTRGVAGLDAVTLGLLGMVALVFVSALTVGAAGQLLSERVQQSAREEAFRELLAKDVSFHLRERSGDLMARVNGDTQMLSVMILPGCTMLLSSALSTLIPLAGIALLDARLLPVPLLFAGAAYVLLRRHTRALEPHTWRVRGGYGQINAVATEAMNGLDVVRAHGLQPLMLGRFERASRSYRDAFMAQAGVEARYTPTLLYALALAAAIAHALWLNAQGSLTLGAVIAYLGLFAQFHNPVSVPLYGLSLVQLGLASAGRVLEILRAESHAPHEGPHEGPLRGAVKLEGLGASRGERPVLNEVNLSIRPGEHVAVIGATGGGKTTLLHLIAGIVEPREGAVLLDDVDVRHWRQDALRRQVAFLEGEAFLFNRSVADNVRFGSRDALSDEAVWRALEDAQAADFVAALPNGADTLVGERGVRLSGGQRQRVALARALINRAPLLLLDDATSALDEATGVALMAALRVRHADRTLVMVTNRWAELHGADRIVLVHDRRVESFPSVSALRASEFGRRVDEVYRATTDNTGDAA